MAASNASGGLLLIVVALLLGGCATTTSVSCPALKTYTREQMVAVADELRKLPLGSPTAGMVADYGQLRAACRTLSR